MMNDGSMSLPSSFCAHENSHGDTQVSGDGEREKRRRITILRANRVNVDDSPTNEWFLFLSALVGRVRKSDCASCVSCGFQMSFLPGHNLNMQKIQRLGRARPNSQTTNSIPSGS